MARLFILRSGSAINKILQIICAAFNVANFVFFYLVSEEIGDSWKYSYRPCCETVFLSMFHEFREVLIPCVVNLARDNSRPVDPSDLKAILYKDAVYNAVGLASFDLYGEVSR